MAIELTPWLTLFWLIPVTYIHLRREAEFRPVTAGVALPPEAAEDPEAYALQIQYRRLLFWPCFILLAAQLAGPFLQTGEGVRWLLYGIWVDLAVVLPPLSLVWYHQALLGLRRIRDQLAQAHPDWTAAQGDGHWLWALGFCYEPHTAQSRVAGPAGTGGVLLNLARPAGKAAVALLAALLLSLPLRGGVAAGPGERRSGLRLRPLRHRRSPPLSGRRERPAMSPFLPARWSPTLPRGGRTPAGP